MGWFQNSPSVRDNSGTATGLRSSVAVASPGWPVAGAAPLSLGTAGARRCVPRALRNPARIRRTLWPPSPPRVGVKEHPSPLVTETKTWGPSRQVKVQGAASPRLLPEGGGDPPRAPGRAGPASAGSSALHPPLIKVGSLPDNRGERGRVTNDPDFCGVGVSSLHCPLSGSV